MAIPNGSPATAIAVTFPATIVLNTADIAPDTEAWYVFTSSANRYLFSIIVQNTTAEYPYVSVFASDNTTPVPPTAPIGDRIDPVNFPIDPETTYYFTITPEGAATAIATVDVDEAPFDTFAAGDLLIFGAQTQSPVAVVIDQTTGTVLRSTRFETTEFVFGGVLPTGTMLLDPADTSADLLMASAQTLAVTGVTVARPQVALFHVMSDKVDTFYLIVEGAGGVVNGEVWKVTEDGTITLKATAIETTIGGTDVSVGGHILYYVDQTSGSAWPLHRWDLDADTALSDFAAGITNFRIADTLVLANDEVLVAYFNNADRTQDFIRHYTSGGAFIQDFPNANNWRHAWIGAAPDDPLSFWWQVQEDFTNYQMNFRRILLSDASDVKNFTIHERANFLMQPETETTIAFQPGNTASFFILPVDSESPPEPTVRPEPTMATPQPCCGGTTPVGTKAGPMLPAISPVWTRRHDTDGTVPTQADVTNSEDWTLENSAPCVRFTLFLTEYPVTSGGTVIKRWSRRPFGDADWSEGRILGIGDIVRDSTDQDGNFRLASLRIDLTDGDHLIREMLETVGTEYFYGREGVLEILSEAGRRANLEWRVIFRGPCVNVQTTAGHSASVECQDLIGSKFSGFDLDKTIGVLLGDEHTSLPDESRGRMYPIVIGEMSDYPALDANGNDARKGLLPVIDTGDYDISGSSGSPDHSPPPVITDSGVVGTTGEHTYYYAATVITPYGESGLSNVVSCDGAANRSLSNYNWLEGTYDNGGASPFNKVRIWRSESADPGSFHLWLDEANYTTPGPGTFAYADGAAPFSVAGDPSSVTRDELDSEKDGSDIRLSTALNSDSIWGRLLVCIGAFTVDDILWSNVLDAQEPFRVSADVGSPALEGVEWMTSSSPQWPHAEPTISLTNPDTNETIEATYIYVRGPRLNAHRDGSVTIAVNGAMTNNVVQAFRAGQEFINEHILKDKGTGYRNGAFGTLELFENGDSQLWTSQWEAMQLLSATRIGGEGYLSDYALTEPITVREWVRRFCLSFDCRLAVNQHGQIYPVLVNDLADPVDGRAYREVIDQVRFIQAPFAHDEIENRIDYRFDYDPDLGDYRVLDQRLDDPNSIAAHVSGGIVGEPNPKGVHQGEMQDLYCCRDPETALDSRTRRLTRNRKAPRYPTHRQGVMGLEDDLGAQIRFTHREGKGLTGDILTPLCVVRSVVRVIGTIETEFTGIDLDRIQQGSG